MVHFEEKNAGDTVSARLLDEKMGHFDPIVRDSVEFKYYFVKIRSLTSSKLGRFRHILREFYIAQTFYPIGF